MVKFSYKKIMGILLCSVLAFTVQAQTEIKMYTTVKKGQGKYLGAITAQDTQYGLLLTPQLTGITPGLHGFHVHQNPSCDDMGMAAGGHLDPANTGKHLGPYNNKGHLGDLPPLYINQKGEALLPVLAPRLKESDLKGHALMIHVGGDNYDDTPAPLGGGGARMACGVVQ